MDREEVVAWMRNPVTEWFLQALLEQYPDDTWRNAPDWEHLNRLKGRQDILDYIRRPQDLVSE